MRVLKKIVFTLTAMLLLLIVLPALTVWSCRRGLPPAGEKTERITTKVWNHRTQELMALPLGEYLAGVVAAEMPAQFHQEALRAQAIVARTYALARLRSGGGPGCDRHPDADVCTDSTHCQAWISQEQAYSQWPFFRQRVYWNKIWRAVTETGGQVITHQGRLIDAVFHSTCGGSTENSEDVWTNAVPYLRAVACPYCSHSPRLTETVRLKREDVAARLEVEPAVLRLQVLRSTPSGRIIDVDVGGKVMRGLEFRTSLGLRSSKVSWLEENGTFSFTTMGYGHAVGMCQYGADGMARLGHSAEEIIEHYFTGVSVQRVRWEE
ncbi:MAG: stage II sporulation protein D [Firmicutes bacterium]|nr:stage II sporulation protein D [Bacillota bacterium]HOB35329.1 stage II sporulation protein D [Bacillota bacterium]HPZ90170.1 stage II sporulation protein D [Bacillota bacterium]HQE01560.1 stage II sporulation protein D [Bacillota bacterium]